MKSANFLGGAYQAFSKTLADQRCVNLYTEMALEGGKEVGALYKTPGLLQLGNIGAGPIRGFNVMGTHLYMVSGNELYEVFGGTPWTGTLLGAVNGTGPVSMDNNGSQVFVACNPDAFIWDSTTATFGQVVDPDFPGAVTVCFIDGYFVFNQPNSQFFWITAINDGFDIDALDFSSAEGFPDNIVCVFAIHRELWLFGTQSIEVWYDSGNPDFPFERIQGAFIEVGIASPYAVARQDNTLFWLGQDREGYGQIYRANGYIPQRISTSAIEQAILTYSTLSDAFAFTYQVLGHQFFWITFPTADGVINGQTWVYDVLTNLWHERAYLNPGTGALERHRASCHAFFGGGSSHIVGDYQSGKIFALSTSTYQDDGHPQKWLRSWRPLAPGTNDLKRVQYYKMQVDAQMGFGIQGSPLLPSHANLRWSDDGGFNFGNTRQVSFGVQGATKTRAIWRRLGKSRDRVYELSGTDNAKYVLLSAVLQAQESAS